MKRFVFLIVMVAGLAGCATPIVTDHSTITYQGRSYVVQYVTFEGGALSGELRNVNAAGVETTPSYYQVIVDGQPYRCSGGPNTCADALRAALRNLADDGNDDEDSGGGCYGGGY